MNNYAVVNDFTIKMYGSMVEKLTGKKEFSSTVTDKITSIPTPELIITSTEIPKGPQHANMKGTLGGNQLLNDDELNFQMLVDEDYANYDFFVKLIRSYIPKYREKILGAQDDTDLTMEVEIRNSKGDVVRVFRYNKVDPLRIGQLQLDSGDMGTNYVILDITLKYDSFNVTDKNGNIIL